MKPREIYRSAETGRLVTKEFAEANPKTTIKETVEIKDTLQSEMARTHISGIIEGLEEHANAKGKDTSEAFAHDAEVLKGLL